MEKIENGIFEYSDPIKIPSLVEIENAHRRALAKGADKFAVVIGGEGFGYNPQKRGIFKLPKGEYQLLTSAPAPAAPVEQPAPVEDVPAAPEDIPETAGEDEKTETPVEAVNEPVSDETVRAENEPSDTKNAVCDAETAVIAAIKETIGQYKETIARYADRCLAYEKRIKELEEQNAAILSGCVENKKAAETAREMCAKMLELFK